MRSWRHRLWPMVAVAYTLAIFVSGSLSAGAGGPSGSDKILHAVGFGVQFGLLWAAVRSIGGTAGRATAVAAVVATISGGALELWQALLPHRSAEWGDFLADVLGIGLVAVALALGRRRPAT